MINLLSFFHVKKNGTVISSQLKKTKKKPGKRSKTKPQASKNQTTQIIELVWLKQLINRKLAIVFSILLVILSVPYMLPAEGVLPINRIKVEGNYKQLDLKSINGYLNTYLGKGFFSIDLKSIQQQINLQPWIQTVSVKRIWPDKLHVNIKEKQAVARWDKNHLLSAQAVIFEAEADSNKFANLPRLNGYSGQSRELLKRYSDMQKEFLKHGLIIAEMTEDSKGALSLILNKNLKVNIGSENNAVKIKHLLMVYPQQIKPRIEQIKTIDFRYSNGFSIAWKDEYLKQMSFENKKRGNKNV